MSDKLALLGGPKTIAREFKRYNPYGPEEPAAAKAVVESGVLSKFIGAWSEDFYGGVKVKEFEAAWADYFGVSHAVSVNSATSGLMAALGAIGIEPGDEVIVSPWTMSASATAILVWNAVPVFADIDADTFNLDPASIEKNITPLTKAIVVPDIFGQAADLDAIMAIARKYRLKVVEDAAQAPGAFYRGRYVGTVADIGVFSFNYHKHIHTGEGGMCVTNDPALAERMQLIRNHAEAVAAGKELDNLTNLVGFNFRMGEIEAAIGLEQLKKLKRLAASKSAVGQRLTEELAGLAGLKTPVVQKDCTHVYYVYALTVDEAVLGVPRDRLIEALRAEGVPGVMRGYTNIHLLPIYQRKIAYGAKGFPWVPEIYKGNVSYEKGICPVAERLHGSAMIGLQPCLHEYADEETDLVISAFRKVWRGMEGLR